MIILTSSIDLVEEGSILINNTSHIDQATEEKYISSKADAF